MKKKPIIIGIIAVLGLVLFGYLFAVFVMFADVDCHTPLVITKYPTEIRKTPSLKDVLVLTKNDLNEVPRLVQAIQDLTNETDRQVSIMSSEEPSPRYYEKWLYEKYLSHYNGSELPYGYFVYDNEIYTMSRSICEGRH